jgi:4-amino-4-deoxy-L-arabinose transferase-like glycosyltransferase
MAGPQTGSPSSRADFRRLKRAALAALLLAFAAAAVRLWVMEAVFPVKPLGDEMYYVVVAANIADGRGHVYGRGSRALRPPAHAWLLSHFVDPGELMGRSPDAAGRPGVRFDRLRPLLRVEVALGTALVLATALLGWALFDARTGLAAGCIAAVYPTFVAYSHFLWSETLFALLVTVALAAFVFAEGRRSPGLSLLAGALFGAAALTREIALPVAAAAALWAVVRAQAGGRRAAAARGAVVLGCAALVVLPWALRNYGQVGRFLPISSVGWIAIGEGNALEGAEWLRPAAPGRRKFRSEVLAIPGESARVDYARRRTISMIANQQPLWLFEKLAHNVPLMFSPDAFQLYKLRNGSYGDVSPAAVHLVTGATVLTYAVVTCLAAFGIAAARRDRRRLLACLVLGAVVGLHVLANANSRFRMPWMPLLMAYAAHALFGGRALLAELRRGERLAAFTVAALVVGVCASYFWVDWGR